MADTARPGFRSRPDPAGQPDAHAVASRYLAALAGYLTVAAAQGFAAAGQRSLT